MAEREMSSKYEQLLKELSYGVLVALTSYPGHLVWE